MTPGMFRGVCEDTTPQTNAPHNQVGREDLAAFIRDFSRRTQGFFNLTLVKENGQGYNAVFHEGGATPKWRVALMTSGEPPIVGSSWLVRDTVEALLADGQFSPKVEQIVNQTLMGSLGCVLLKVQNGKIQSAHFHEGEIWP